ncbi:WD40/YVTN/BNR-like repeat-containing protein [Aquabacterium sp.]|uniref:WD40/YVTN/BNR-like repeat-containing protein n=1 Tax=Aquabacterium sp. TaxID=1872578 RepID=UPI002B79AF44|nr:YCF48-related protein [Aquabacterium sp.]HSW03785.1 YCF48-related protein [Aquabacterium sp.]
MPPFIASPARRRLCAALGLLPVAAGAFQPPQEIAAQPTLLAANSPLLAIARAGARIVAAGPRGHIVWSDDNGARWTQAAVPVSSDLLAISFASARHGWAVGHGGVVLHSNDGGATWQRQLGGRQANDVALRHLETRASTDAQAALLLQREKAQGADGSTPSFLDVHFSSETSGFIVGTFNRIFRTEDGGRTWTPWMDRTQNPGDLHFYAVRGSARGIFLAGEQGMVWRLEPNGQRFEAVATPYKGTLFGLVATDAGTLLAYGMRGRLFRSDDEGRQWQTVAGVGTAGITAGTALPGGAIVLVDQAGGIALSRDGGQHFQPVPALQPMPYFGVTALGAQRIGLVGAAGARLQTLAIEQIK